MFNIISHASQSNILLKQWSLFILLIIKELWYWFRDLFYDCNSIDWIFVEITLLQCESHCCLHEEIDILNDFFFRSIVSPHSLGFLKQFELRIMILLFLQKEFLLCIVSKELKKNRMYPFLNYANIKLILIFS